MTTRPHQSPAVAPPRPSRRRLTSLPARRRFRITAEWAAAAAALLAVVAAGASVWYAHEMDGIARGQLTAATDQATAAKAQTRAAEGQLAAANAQTDLIRQQLRAAFSANLFAKQFDLVAATFGSMQRTCRTIPRSVRESDRAESLSDTDKAWLASFMADTRKRFRADVEQHWPELALALPSSVFDSLADREVIAKIVVSASFSLGVYGGSASYTSTTVRPPYEVAQLECRDVDAIWSCLKARFDDGLAITGNDAVPECMRARSAKPSSPTSPEGAKR
jgi:hypothetical protein